MKLQKFSFCICATTVLLYINCDTSCDANFIILMHTSNTTCKKVQLFHPIKAHVSQPVSKLPGK